MADELELEIVTPFGSIYTGRVSGCILPGEDGSFQVLNRHAALISLITIGVIRVMDSGQEERYFATSGGYAEIKDNRIRVIVESAEPADTIDVTRAEGARKRAENRIKQKESGLDVRRAELALARALNRIKLAQSGG